MPARPLVLDHIALPAKDAQATLDFFGGVLGLPLVGAQSGDDWGGHPWLMMMFGVSDGRQIALCVLDGAEAIDEVAYTDDLPHFAFGVPDEAALEAWRVRLHEGGVDVREEDHGTARSIYFKDPSGLGWEITTATDAPAADVADEDEPETLVRTWIRKRSRT
jgi:catechol 2,3-dioxygenase-like lactoylglutathione lyase family enzyme